MDQPATRRPRPPRRAGASPVRSPNPQTPDIWPQCASPAQFAPPGQSIRWGCAIGVDAPASTYTGLISTLGFDCTDEESFDNKINLVHGLSDTAVDGLYAEGAGTVETLTIGCGEPPPAPDAERPQATA